MFTKIKNDSFKLELSNCCVSRLLKQTVFSYYEEWKKQGIEPSLDICEDTIFITANVQALQAGVSECNKKCAGAWAEEHLHTDEAAGFVQLQGFRLRAYFKK